MKTGFFKYGSIEECALHTSDRAYEFVVELMCASFPEEAYAGCLIYLSGREVKNFPWGWSYPSIPEIIHALPKERTAEDALIINNVMHILHVENPDARDEAIFLCNEILKEVGEESCQERVYFANYPAHLDGKDSFPGELREEIEKISSLYSDVAVECHVTWYFSHISEGVDYDYSMDETPYVEVTALNKESLNACINAIKAIKYV